MTQKPTAVFDFDGTIISKDSYYEFTKQLIRNSVLRSFFTIFSLPIIIPLVCIPSTKKWGFNIPCFIATVGQKHSLFKLRHQFIEYFLEKADVTVYQDALKDLQWHREKGEQIVIISGCPNWLLHALVKAIGIENVKIIGSKQKLFLSGLLIQHHCFGANKINMARKANQQTSLWTTGYSDSSTDIPMLNLCKKAVLINSSRSSINQFETKLKIPSTYRNYR